MKKFKLVAAVLLVLSGAYGTEAIAKANCGGSTFQIDNQTGQNLTVESVTGNVLGSIANVTVKPEKGHPDHLISLSQSCANSNCSVTAHHINVPNSCAITATISVNTNSSGNCSIYSDVVGGAVGNQAVCAVASCVEMSWEDASAYPTLVVCNPGQTCSCPS